MRGRPSPAAIREAGRVLAVEDIAAMSRTPREQAELAYTPTGPSVDELEDLIRAQRGLEPIDRSAQAS